MFSMAVFEYKALNAKGKKVSGIIDADSLSAAAQKLKQQQIYPVSLAGIEPDAAGREKSSFFPTDRFIFLVRVSSADLTLFTRQMATLLSAGFPLVKALETLVQQAKSNTMKKVLSKIKDAVEGGSSFADALAFYPGVFSPVFVNMVRAGESSGTLEIVLERLADFNENREDSKKKIRAALAYPLLMSVIGFGILLILMAYVVPGIINIFSDMNHALPQPTKILIAVSSFFTSYWPALLATPILLAGMAAIVRTRETGRHVTDSLMISLPMIGTLLKKHTTARFTRTLSSLLENGIPLLTALHITGTIAGNTRFEKLIASGCDTVEQGGALGDVLAASPVFPTLASQMIKIGETSGELEKMLEKTADLYERDVQSAVSAASSLVEPVIILVMGILVGGIIFSICLPIFEISQLIQ